MEEERKREREREGEKVQLEEERFETGTNSAFIKSSPRIPWREKREFC